MTALGRRRFLWLTGVGGASAALPALMIEPAGAAPPNARPTSESPAELRRHLARKTGRALGTKVSLAALHERVEVARRAVETAFGELERVERLMSIYRPDSQLTRLNRTKRLRDPHPDLVAVLKSATAMSQRTGGAFDITVQPLWALFSAAKRAGRLPTTDEIQAARRQVDWRQVKITGHEIRLAGRDTLLTLNGIAQGFAADQAAAAFRRHGIAHGLIDTGELSGLGRNARGSGWNVGIQHPRNDDAYVAVARLSGRCLATSGDYATTFSDDHSHHHLFDPRSGSSARELTSVSVVAPTALTADALSTAAFVLGVEAGSKLIVDTPGAAGLLVTRDGRTLQTPGFPVG